MSLYSKNNHFRIGYDNKAGFLRENPKQSFSFEVGKCQRIPYDFRAECQIAAREIHNHFKDSLTLCLSGGLDSEIMAEAFFHAGVPFRSMIMRFQDNANIHDIAWAIAYCEKRGLPYEFFDVDVPDFFQSGEYREFARFSQCGYPFILLYLKMLEHLYKQSRVPALGVGDLHFKKVQSHWLFYHQEFWSGYEKYCFSRDHKYLVKFFEWSPELILSYISNPRLLGYFSDPTFPLTDLGLLKHQIYSDYFVCAERKKYRGFEKLSHLHVNYLDELKKEFLWEDQIAVIEVRKLMSHLYAREIK